MWEKQHFLLFLSPLGQVEGRELEKPQWTGKSHGFCEKVLTWGRTGRVGGDAELGHVPPMFSAHFVPGPSRVLGSRAG